MSQVNATITHSSQKVDIMTLDESYNVTFANGTIFLQAITHFGLARALATLVQLVDVHPALPNDTQAYAIYQANVSDHPAFKWREILVDGARHYLSIDALHKQIDAMSIAKFNILHLHASDAESFPMWFNSTPESNLIKGAWSPYYFYNMTDLRSLQSYCFQRGIILYIEIDMPGHAASWGKADSTIVANCPSYSSNINNIPLNPAVNATYDYIKGALNELLNGGSFEDNDSKIVPMIHLGGDEIVAGCWKEDPTISAYMAKNNLTT